MNSIKPTSQWENQHENNVKRASKYCFLFCFLAAFPCIISFMGFLKPDSQPLNIWFQRSGALMTVFALLAQNKVSQIKELLTPNTFSTRAFNSIIIRYRTHLRAWNIFSLLLVIMGTVIWGYGDLFF